MEFIEDCPCITVSIDEIENVSEFLDLLERADKEYMYQLEKFKLRPLVSRTKLCLDLALPSEGDNAYTYGLHIFIYGFAINKFVKKEQKKQKYQEFVRVFDPVQIHFRINEPYELETGGIISIDLDDDVCVTLITDNSSVIRSSFDYRFGNIKKYIDEKLFRNGKYWPCDNMKFLD